MFYIHKDETCLLDINVPDNLIIFRIYIQIRIEVKEYDMFGKLLEIRVYMDFSMSNKIKQ